MLQYSNYFSICVFKVKLFWSFEVLQISFKYLYLYFEFVYVIALKYLDF